ncbi:MAG: MBL fold metallo-hydrolase, partial [Gammaproteobacteria bacterium]|nr:MBL fold metallo-hydrolase [Gammaproteobacteria bacterium]
MNRWQIGDVRITRIVEMEVAGGTRFILPQGTPEAVSSMQWLVPHFATPEGKLIMSVHALVIETPDRLMLVDTCIGNDKDRSIPNWHQLSLPFLEDLAKAGYEPEQFDTIMCTHLHVDHVGWNTRLINGVWVPTFKNARYLIGKTEYEHWQAADPSDLNDGIFEDSVLPVMNAGLMDLVAADHQVSEEVSFVSTPGHTPGHVSILIRSKAKQALITGDCIHHPCQIEQTHWSSSADFDASRAIATRENLVAAYANQPT